MLPVDYWKRITSVDIIGLSQWILLATASTVFVKHILLVEKCFKAFFIHLCYFVHLSGE